MQPNKTVISSIKARTSRIYKMEDEMEELKEETLEKDAIEISRGTVNDVKVKKERKQKKRAKSRIVLTSNFPSEIDFNHPYRQIIMAIKTKPFLLLTGMCGTGKSRFARILAYQTCPKYLQEEGLPGNFKMIAVQPDWCNSDEIMGWLSLKGVYQFTPFLHFLIKSWRYTDTPFILCLDEMNLAKVEQYFANFLSVIESRQWVNNELVSDALISATQIQSYIDRDPNMWARAGLKLDSGLQNRFLTNGITLPPNLIIIGTANIDESGHMFSLKVLDRAMVLEMEGIDFYSGITADDTDLKFPDTPLSNSHIFGNLLSSKDAYALSSTSGDLIISELQSIDQILSGSSFRFGYRVRDAALIYFAYCSQLPNYQNSKETVYKCLDEILLMKILPRISGNGKVIEDVLDGLLHFAKTKYPRSFQRLLNMQSQGNEFSFISFWQ